MNNNDANSNSTSTKNLHVEASKLRNVCREYTKHVALGLNISL